MVYKIVDYRGEARGRITAQFEDKVNFNRYLNLMLNGSMELQDVFRSLKENRWIDSARGVMLDIIGEIVGQDRVVEDEDLSKYFAFLGVPLGKGYSDLEDREIGGEYRDLFVDEDASYVSLTDSEYRTFILSKIFRNTTNASPDEFISFFEFVFDVREVEFSELGNAVVDATITGKFTEFEKSLIYYTKDNLGNSTFFVPKPVGVRLDMDIINLNDGESLIGFTNFEIIDSHILKDIDDALGFYVAVNRNSKVWQGATISFSTDGGITYPQEFSLSQESVMGELTNDIPAHPHWYQDVDSVIGVDLLGYADYTIPAKTHRQALDNEGMILVGDEIMSYEGSIKTSPTTWGLSKLLRGRKGSTSTSHSAGERVVLLNPDIVPFIKDIPLTKGQTYTIKIRSNDTTTKEFTQVFTYQAASQTERAPTKLSVRRDGSDMHVSWLGVGRLDGSEEMDGAKMGQHFTGYKVTSDGVDHLTQDEKITIPYKSGLVKVVQLNSITGEGDSAEVNV